MEIAVCTTTSVHVKPLYVRYFDISLYSLPNNGLEDVYLIWYETIETIVLVYMQHYPLYRTMGGELVNSHGPPFIFIRS